MRTIKSGHLGWSGSQKMIFSMILLKLSIIKIAINYITSAMEEGAIEDADTFSLKKSVKNP